MRQLGDKSRPEESRGNGMRFAPHGSTRMRTLRAQRGFTLVELMIVVAVLAILAVVAIVSFSKVKAKAMRSEAVSVLGAISLRQEAYRAEFSEYKTCSGAVGTPSRAKTTITKPPCWTDHLGLQTDNQLYCAYTIYGGAPGAWTLVGRGKPTVNDNGGATALPSQDYQAFGGTAPSTAWYLGKAECDFDGEPTTNMFLYRTHASSGLGEVNPDR
jgi:prepilin-type N-terminal cleavage/methylation domain-containing protein